MRRPAFLAATALTALLGIYVALVAGRAVVLLRDDALIAKALGAAFLVLPAIAVWFLVQEWRLGVAVQRMARRLEAEGRLPRADGPRTPSGRLAEDAARDAYDLARREVDLSPDDWAAWFHLAFAYEDLGDKSQARRSLRYAAQLLRRENDHQSPL